MSSVLAALRLPEPRSALLHASVSPTDQTRCAGPELPRVCWPLPSRCCRRCCRPRARRPWLSRPAISSCSASGSPARRTRRTVGLIDPAEEGDTPLKVRWRCSRRAADASAQPAHRLQSVGFPNCPDPACVRSSLPRHADRVAQPPFNYVTVPSQMLLHKLTDARRAPEDRHRPGRSVAGPRTLPLTSSDRADLHRCAPVSLRPV